MTKKQLQPASYDPPALVLSQSQFLGNQLPKPDGTIHKPVIMTPILNFSYFVLVCYDFVVPKSAALILVNKTGVSAKWESFRHPGALIHNWNQNWNRDNTIQHGSNELTQGLQSGTAAQKGSHKVRPHRRGKGYKNCPILILCIAEPYSPEVTCRVQSILMPLIP